MFRVWGLRFRVYPKAFTAVMGFLEEGLGFRGLSFGLSLWGVHEP